MPSIINIPVKELNEVCAKKDRKWATSTHFNLVNRELVHEVFKYQKFQDDFAENIVCFNNGKDFIGSFKPSYNEFLFSIIKALHLNDNKSYVDDESLTKLFNEKLEFLRTIPDEAWLYNNFPVLYRNLQNGRKYIKEVEKDKDNRVNEEITKEEEHYYYSCAMRKNFSSFVQNQLVSYRRFVEKRHKYEKLIEKVDYDNFIKENYDQDKLALYLAYKYITICEDNFDDKASLNTYIKLLDKYIKSDYNKEVSIYVDHNEIEYKDIVNRLEIIKSKNKKVGGEVAWTLIPEGRREKYVKAGLDPQKHIMSYEEFLALKEAGEAKEKFYNDNPPMLKVYGRLKYSGYIAYIYPNGMVFFDMEYNKDYPTTAKGNAIYYMKAKYFDMVSGLDKQVLKTHPAVDKIVHRGAWQDRARKIIDEETSIEDKEDAKQLVKRIIEENKKNI